MESGDQITIEMRLAALEEKVDRLLTYFGLDDAGAGATPGAVMGVDRLPVADAQVATLIQAGKKIQAIKLYRQLTGATLKTAKDAVDEMERSMRANAGRR
jgi:ribosomal protein L7/L12